MVRHEDSRLVDWREVLDDARIDCVITDPPFGADYQSRRVTTIEGKEYARPIDNDANELGAIQVYLDVMRPLLEHAAEECEVFTFTRWDVLPAWIEAVKSLSDLGLVYKMLMVWDKGALGMGDIDASFGASHEFILYSKKGRRDLNYQRSSVLRFDRPAPSARIHPTEKPVALLEELIKTCTDPGDVVVDPFAGSGSTIAAAQRQGRIGIGIEKHGPYAAKANERLAQSLLF